MLSSGKRIVVEGRILRTCGTKEGVHSDRLHATKWEHTLSSMTGKGTINHKNTMATGVVMPASISLVVAVVV